MYIKHILVDIWISEEPLITDLKSFESCIVNDGSGSTWRATVGNYDSTEPASLIEVNKTIDFQPPVNTTEVSLMSAWSLYSCREIVSRKS